MSLIANLMGTIPKRLVIRKDANFHLGIKFGYILGLMKVFDIKE